MAATQSHRSGGAPAPPAGTCNRGFSSSDPERQPEPLTDEGRRSKAQPAIRVDVRLPPGAVRKPRKQAAPAAPGSGKRRGA